MMPIILTVADIGTVKMPEKTRNNTLALHAKMTANILLMIMITIIYIINSAKQRQHLEKAA